MSKLERAENRRTRVRQKLLEHVAGALIMQSTMVDRSPQSVLSGENTPPRSPTKTHSPQRLAAPVQVTSPEPPSRRSVESIRIYADSDVYALMADVEDEINRMGDHTDNAQESKDANTPRDREVNKRPAITAGLTLNAVTFSPNPLPTMV